MIHCVQITRNPKRQDRDEWTVDLEDGERPGLAWAAADAFADEEASRELERQQVVLGRAFKPRLRSLAGLELKR